MNSPAPGPMPPIEQFLAHVLQLYGGSPPAPGPIPTASAAPAGLPWGDFATEVLSVYSAARAPLTRSKMRQVLRIFGSLPTVRSVADLTPGNVAEFKRAVAVGRAPATVAGLISYLSAAASYAVSRGYLWSSPFAAVRDWGTGSEPIDEEDQAEAGHHPIEAIGRVLDHLAGNRGSWKGHRLYALACVVAFTGLRKREALCLKVADVDLEARAIHVRRRRRLKRPTAAAPVPVPDVLAEVLSGWLPRVGSEWLIPKLDRSGPWLHGGPGGRPLDRLVAAAEEAGVPGFTFQSLRHSWATHAESAWGLSELVVQRVLRHTTTRTQKLYRKADLANLASAVRSIDFGPSSVAS